MSESVEFGLDLTGNTAAVAKKMAAELERLKSELDRVSRSHTKVERAFAKSVAFSPSGWKDITGHARALERSKKAYTSLAPASAAAARGLRAFGVSGGWIRKFSIDTAKGEIALRRLYRLKGGGFSGGAAVAGALGRRGVARYGGSVMGGIGSAAMAGAGAAGTAGLLAGGAALTGAGFLGFDMASTAIDADRLRFALDRITNGQGEKWWKTSSEYAEKFGLNVNNVAESLMGMQATGLSGDTTMEMFQRFADMKSQGVGSNQIDLALLGFKQMMSNGVVQMEDLKQVTENLMLSRGLVMETLGTQMGKTVAQVTKLQGSGQLKSTDMAKAISTAIGIQTKSPEAGGAGAAASNATVVGMWDKLKATWSVESANALSGGMLDPLKTAMGSLTSWMTGEGGRAAIGGFGRLISKMFEAAPGIIDGVIWLLDVGLPAAWQGFSAAFSQSGAGETMSGLLENFRDLGGDGGKNAAASLRDIGSAVGELTGAIVTLAGWLTTAIDDLVWLDEKAAGAQEWLGLGGGAEAANKNGADGAANDNGGGLFDFGFTGGGILGLFGAGENDNSNSSMFSSGFNMAMGLANGLAAGNPVVAAAASSLGASAEEALRTQQEIHSPGRKMRALGRYDAQGYSLGMTDELPTISSAANNMGTSATSGAAGSGGVSAGGITINVYIDGKEVSGKSEGEIGDLIGQRVRKELVSVFGQIAYSGAA